MQVPIDYMRPLNRRDFCLCLGCSATVFAARAEDSPLYTCNLSFDALASTVDKSTIRPLDFLKQNFANGLKPVVTDITDFLGITLDLFTYEDGKAPNAAFTADQTYRPPDWTGQGAEDGIILLGESFIRELEAYFGSLGAPLTAVCAHEAGHALQASMLPSRRMIFMRTATNSAPTSSAAMSLIIEGPSIRATLQLCRL
jgi:hypothetical protein